LAAAGPDLRHYRGELILLGLVPFISIDSNGVEPMSSEPNPAVATQTVSQSPSPQDALQRVAGAMMVAATAVQQGAADAQTKARQLAPRIGRAFSKTVYATCYYTSYGVVFPTLLIVSLLPSENAIGYGLGDGARAARDAVAELQAQRQARREAARKQAAAASEASSGVVAMAPA